MTAAKQMDLHLGKGRRFRNLLILFLIQIVVSPILVHTVAGGYIDDILFFAILIAGLRSVRQRNDRLIIVSHILFAVFVALDLSNYALNSLPLLVTANYIGATVLCITMWKMFGFIAKQERVDADTVYGGLCVYILLGVLWCIFYVNMELIRPGSFSFTVHHAPANLLETYWLLSFFSYTTLMTTGLGDVVPMTSISQSLVVLEGIIGQFYLVFFMARLVGLYIAQSGERKRTQPGQS